MTPEIEVRPGDYGFTGPHPKGYMMIFNQSEAPEGWEIVPGFIVCVKK